MNAREISFEMDNLIKKAGNVEIIDIITEKHHIETMYLTKHNRIAILKNDFEIRDIDKEDLSNVKKYERNHKICIDDVNKWINEEEYKNILNILKNK